MQWWPGSVTDYSLCSAGWPAALLGSDSSHYPPRAGFYLIDNYLTVNIGGVSGAALARSFLRPGRRSHSAVRTPAPTPHSRSLSASKKPADLLAACAGRTFKETDLVIKSFILTP